MAQPTTAKFGKFRVLLGDGQSPEVFTVPCGFTSKALTVSKNLTEINLPDCLDPDAAAWVGRDVESLSAAITGEGVLAAESIDAWYAALLSTSSLNVRIEIEFPLITYTWQGLMHVSEFAHNADQGGRTTANVTMASDGELVLTNATT
ncbi:MAG: phage tail protein [Alphaproteobacteria bacterium]|nr:phage tail protein [Alphaproteobacteria bacterium]